MGNASSCSPQPAVSALPVCSLNHTKTPYLLELDDRLLCEIFKPISVYDKRQHVQRTCMRFRHVLQQPQLPKTWGCVAVRMSHVTDASPQNICRLITWLLDRKSGITVLKLLTDCVDLEKPYDTGRGMREQTALHALTAVFAAEDVPASYAGHAKGGLAVSAPLSFAHIDAETAALLQQSIEGLAIRCSDFLPEHWDMLCSLSRVRNMGLCLQTADQHAPLAPYHHGDHVMQLSSLRQLVFTHCRVSLQPMLQHLSALSHLTSLYFHQCPRGLYALWPGMPPLEYLVDLTFSECYLLMLPPLKQLLRLEKLNLDGNPGLKDVGLGCRGLTSLTKLSMQASTPLDAGTLGVLKELPVLKEFDVRGQVWTPKNAALLGRLQHWSHAQGIKLVV